MSSYDFISIADDDELMSAFNLVMGEVDQQLKLKMAVPSQFYYEDMPDAMRSICNEDSEIKNLVNEAIKKDRYSVVLRKYPDLTSEELDKILSI